MRRSWLYLATRSVREAEPVLIWPQLGGHREVGDGGVLGLAAAVAHHAGVAGAAGQRHAVERLGEGADLVDLHEHGVGDALRDALGQDLRVGDEEVVAHELDLAPERLR